MSLVPTCPVDIIRIHIIERLFAQLPVNFERNVVPYPVFPKAPQREDSKFGFFSKAPSELPHQPGVLVRLCASEGGITERKSTRCVSSRFLQVSQQVMGHRYSGSIIFTRMYVGEPKIVVITRKR